MMNCPVCLRASECRFDTGEAYRGACWCEEIALPVAVVRRLAEDDPEPRCLCRDCLIAVAKGVAQAEPLESILDRRRESENSTVSSPCVNVCRLDENQHCTGCRRSIEEIVSWRDLSEPERSAILERLAERQG